MKNLYIIIFLLGFACMQNVDAAAKKEDRERLLDSAFEREIIFVPTTLGSKRLESFKDCPAENRAVWAEWIGYEAPECLEEARYTITMQGGIITKEQWERLDKLIDGCRILRKPFVSTAFKYVYQDNGKAFEICYNNLIFLQRFAAPKASIATKVLDGVAGDKDDEPLSKYEAAFFPALPQRSFCVVKSKKNPLSLAAQKARL